VGPFGLGDGAFNNYMIYFSIVISVLSLGVKIGVGASDNCEDCAMGEKGFKLLWRFLDLWRRWWRLVDLGLDLGIVTVWHWVCDLWHYRRGMLFVESTKVGGDWLWHSDTIGNKPEVCHTPFRERGNEASIRVPRMIKSHV
jgi:hypothetical protein